MKPKTKIEKEVVRLSAKLPPISERQKEWSLKLVSIKKARRFRGKTTAISHFIIATTKDGWQVLRHYYLYATYKYKKLHNTEYAEVMQQWFKDGEYVFMSRNRQGLGCCADAWCLMQPMSIKRGDASSCCLCDPRHLGYDDVYYARLQKKYSYVPRENKCEERIDTLFRALNTHTFNETLYALHKEAWVWGVRTEFVFDKEKTAAIKIAIRYKYDFKNATWRDMIEMLQYLGKDLHNPSIVCPDNLQKAHDKWSKLAENKRKKLMSKLERIRLIQRERQELQRLERQARWEREQKEREKAAVNIYPKIRGKFFGLLITENDLEIRVLKSVAEFMEEGKEMEHCVFANGYYDLEHHPNSLILSAKENGKRLETIEVSLKDYYIVQCRGKNNKFTERHDEIMELVNKNMNVIKMINTGKYERKCI